MSVVRSDCVRRRNDDVSEMSSSKRSSMSSLRRLRDAFSSSFSSETSSLTSFTRVERRPNTQSRKTKPAQMPETKQRGTLSGRPESHQTKFEMFRSKPSKFPTIPPILSFCTKDQCFSYVSTELPQTAQFALLLTIYPQKCSKFFIGKCALNVQSRGFKLSEARLTFSCLNFCLHKFCLHVNVIMLIFFPE